MLLKGRRKITTEHTTDEIKNDFLALAHLINESMLVHVENKKEIDYLIDYAKGNQTILTKDKLVRPEINNKVVINHARMVTRTTVGYFLGTPIQYIQSGGDVDKEAIDYLNKVVAYEDKASVDGELGEMQSYVGTAYRIIYTDGEFADEVPFENKMLNPSNTFVVYTNDIAERPICGVNYYNTFNSMGTVLKVKYQVYTTYGQYTIETESNGVVDEMSTVEFVQYNVGGLPIIEYPNNIWRMGDWEMTIGLMDAINALQSGRLDDIDQIVQSLIVFINAEIDKDTYDEMREAGVVMLKNNSGNPSSVDSIKNSLDQSGMTGYAGELENLLYAILGIPDRNNRSGGGGDTGQAVELRDGWADLEIVARNKELMFKRAEKQTLRIILNIMNSAMGSEISLMDVDIKFSRNKTNNLQVKTQSYQTLIATKTLDPADCLTIVDLVSDVNEFIERGKTFWGDEFGGKVKEVERVDLAPEATGDEEVIEKDTEVE